MSEKTSRFPNVSSPIPNVHPSAPDESQKSPFSSLQLCNMTSKSHVIAIPVKDANGHEQQVLREVHPYPRAAIQTSVDKTSYVQTPKSSSSKHRRTKRRSVRKSSITSSSSQVSNISSDGASQSLHESDVSSDVSNVSDLSGYEDEYTTIRRILKEGGNAASYKEFVGTHFPRSLKEPSFYELQCQEQEAQLRLLTSQKEELENQIHRFSIQLETSLREKEIYQQQLEFLNTKATEVTQKEHFEILKKNASLEGQHEMLKLQLENTLEEKSLMEGKLESISEELNSLKEQFDSLQSKRLALEETICSKNETNKKGQMQLEELHKQVEFYKNEWLLNSKETSDIKASLNDLQNSLDSQIIANKECRKENSELSSSLSLLKEKLLYSENSCVEQDAIISKLTVEKNSLENSRNWYEQQLSTNQTSKSKALNELSECKGIISSVNTEKNLLEQEVSKLKREIEELRCQMTREKTSFLGHLEEVEANMKEREAALKNPDPNAKHVTNQKLRELEQTQQLVRKQSIELQKLKNTCKNINDELQLKKGTIDRHEQDLCVLKKEKAVMEEHLKQRDIHLASVQLKFEHMTTRYTDARESLADKQLIISKQNSQITELTTSLTTANETIVSVDEATTALKENMSRLTSNFSKLKHDLASKEKDLEKSRYEIRSLQEQQNRSQLNAQECMESATKELECLQANLFEKEEQITSLKESLEEKRSEITKLTHQSKEVSVQLSIAQKKEMMLLKERDDLISGSSMYKSSLSDKENNIKSLMNTVYEKEKELEAQIIKNQTLVKTNSKIQDELEEYSAMKSSDARKIADLEDNLTMERKKKVSIDRTLREHKQSWISTETELKSQLSQQTQKIAGLENTVHSNTESLKLKDNFIISLEETLEKLRLGRSPGNSPVRDALESRYNRQKKLMKRKHRKLVSEITHKNRTLSHTRRQLATKISQLDTILAKDSSHISQNNPVTNGYNEENPCLNGEENETDMPNNNCDNDFYNDPHVNGFNGDSKSTDRLLYESNERLLTRKLKEHMRGRLKAEKELEILEKENKRTATEAFEKYNELMSRFLHLDKMHQSDQDAVRKLQNEMTTLEKSLKSSTKEKEFLQEEILGLQRENSRLEELAKICQGKQTIIASLEGKLKQNKAELEETKKQLQSLTEQKTTWNVEEKSLSDKISHLEKQKMELEEQLSNQVSTTQNHVSKITLLENEVPNLREKLDEKISELAQNKEIISAKEKTLTDIRKNSSETKSKIDELSVNIVQLEAKVQDGNTQKENLRQLLKDSEEQTASACKETDTLRRELESLRLSHQIAIRELEERLSFAKSVESSLNTKLEDVIKQKLFYQSHTTDLKSALHTALSQLKKLKRVSTAAPLKPPPPLPIDKETLENLLNQSKSIDSPSSPLDSISDRLSLLKSEISSLQSHVSSREHDVRNHEVPSEQN